MSAKVILRAERFILFHDFSYIRVEIINDMRLFIAINFSEEIKDSLLDAINNLKEQSLGGNFSRKENLHLTLCFIGETTKVNVIKKIMEKIESESFELSFKNFGRFKRKEGDIFWIGVEQDPRLIALWSYLSKELIAEGFDIEARDYKPHITLGRKVLTQKYPSIDVPDGKFTVSKVDLMKSEHINGKLTYTPIFSAKLD